MKFVSCRNFNERTEVELTAATTVAPNLVGLENKSLRDSSKAFWKSAMALTVPLMRRLSVQTFTCRLRHRL